MASYSYVDNVNSNLICCVCRSPFLNPVVTNTCSHTFCRECILRSLELQLCCPVDRSPLKATDLRPENLLLRNMVDELIVECPHRQSGCKHTCQRQLLEVHLRDSCPYVHVACPEDGCDKTVLRKDLGKHTHGCAHRVLACDACGVSVRAYDLESHYAECTAKDAWCSACGESLRPADLAAHKSECPEVEVPCLHASNGCPWTGPRESLDSKHMSQCPYEAIKGFFQVNETRMATLHDENLTLKHKLLSAESTIRSLRRDLDIARKALGPWWQDEEPSTRAQQLDVPPSIPGGSHRQEESTPDNARWRTSNPLSPILTFSADSPVSSTHELEMSPTSPYSDPAFLAHYFPPASTSGASVQPETSGVPSPDALGRHANPPFLNRLSFPPPIRFPDALQGLAASQGGGARGTPQSTTVRIPPVDYSTSLDGALSGIRSSIVALSTSLDVLERKQNIALTTENLRMNEEVGALRAIVHGLRMQVHSLIMERNGNPWGPTTTTTTSYYNQAPPTPQPLVISSTTSTTKL